MTPRHDRNRRARLQRLAHDPAFQCPGPLAPLEAIGALLSVHYAIGGHFRHGLCHPPIIAPSDDQRQAPFTERLPRSGDPDLRDVAGLKLLAAAACDLAVANDLLETSEKLRIEKERSASQIFSSPEIRETLDAPLEAASIRKLAIERAALPIDPGLARNKLLESITGFVKEIPDETAELSKSAMSGAVNFGLGPANAALSFVNKELLSHIPEGVTFAVRTAARLVTEAIRKLWAAFGPEAQDKIQEETNGWLKEIWEKSDLVRSLLDRLYATAKLNEEVTKIVTDCQAATSAGKFNSATRTLEELEGRYKKIIGILVWVMRAMSWLNSPLTAAAPWGPIAAYAIYAGTFGYAIYSGGDYLDADFFSGKWLDHVRGLRTTVTSSLA